MELKSIKVSIVLAVYNVEDYLDECYRSLANQTHRNLEIISVDDGSTDKSLKIADVWSKKDSRFSFYAQKNSGPALARKKGLEHATGEWVYFVDSDDTLLKEGIETLLKKAIKTDATVLEGGMLRRFEGGKKTFKDSVLLKNKEIKAPFDAFCYSKEPISSCFCGRLFKREFLEKQSLPYLNYPHEDLSFTMAITYHAQKEGFKWVTTAYAPYVYLIRQGSRDRSINREKILKMGENIKAIELYFQKVTENQGQNYPQKELDRGFNSHLNLFLGGSGELKQLTGTEEYNDYLALFLEATGKRGVEALGEVLQKYQSKESKIKKGFSLLFKTPHRLPEFIYRFFYKK